MKTKFQNRTESVRWLAQMNEQGLCFEAAARLYRDIGEEENAQRCDKLSQPPDTQPLTTPEEMK